jgi:hypothetical protein
VGTGAPADARSPEPAELRRLGNRVAWLCLPACVLPLTILLSMPFLWEHQEAARLAFTERLASGQHQGFWDPHITGVLPPTWLQRVYQAAALITLASPLTMLPAGWFILLLPSRRWRLAGLAVWLPLNVPVVFVWWSTLGGGWPWRWVLA